MTTTPDMSLILQDLASGRIDAAEAARRIDALSATRTSSAEAPADGDPDQARPPASSPLSSDAATAAEVPGGPPESAGDEAAASAVGKSDPGAGGDAASDRDAWASTTDRPQHATHRRESVRNARQPARPESPARGQNGVTRISVRAVGRRVRIVGESSVATLSADGPHVLRRNGPVLEVSSDGETGFSLDGFSILRAPRSFEDIRSLGLGKELFLRVNPRIEVDVEVTAGSLVTEGIPHLGRVRVTAGSGKLLGVAEIKDALIQAGSATVKGALTVGRSRIRAESGTLNIQLADDSDVTIRTEAQLGNVSWSGGHTGSGQEVVMGNGHAHLDVEVVMGHAQVRVGSDTPAAAS